LSASDALKILNSGGADELSWNYYTSDAAISEIESISLKEVHAASSEVVKKNCL
jgi:hypothetical protein